MRALDARVETIDADGAVRVIPIAEFHRLPGDTPYIETTLRTGELITAVTLPLPPPGRQMYRKVRDRASYAFALVSVAAVVDTSNGRIRSARIACGGIAPKPWRIERVEEAMTDAPVGALTFDAAATALFEGARGYGDNDFKIPLARRTLRAVLTEITRA
jgi:xanthine dehydrogenase YagS FAD-binding subunit